MGLVPTQNQGQDHLLVSVPERGQRLPVLVCFNKCSSESGLLTQAMHAVAVEVQQFSCIPDKSTAVISSQDLVIVVCVCSSNGMVFLLDAFSGKVLGRYEAPWDVYSSLVLVGNDVIFGCRNDNVYKLNITYES